MPFPLQHIFNTSSNPTSTSRATTSTQRVPTSRAASPLPSGRGTPGMPGGHAEACQGMLGLVYHLTLEHV